MIDLLLELGLIEKDIEIILKEINIESIDKAKLNIDILKSVGIKENTIKNIIVTNPYIFNNNSNKLIELIEKFKIYGFDDLNVLFDANPFILNRTSYELGIFINQKLEEDLTLEEIIESFYNNPFIMDIE